jgi:hypothetical protein
MNNSKREIFALVYSNKKYTSYILNFLIKNGIIVDSVIFRKNDQNEAGKG